MPRSSSAPGPPPLRRHHRALPPLRLLHRHWPAAPDPPPCDLPVAQPSLCTTGGRGGGRGASSRCCCWTPASAPLPVSFVRLLGSRIWPAQRLCSAGGDRGVGDPRAQAGHGAEPGEEAGGLRACAQPDQKLKVTMAQRARWTSQYEKGLVDVLTEYNFSHYRGQNGWTTEGWNRIVKDLNDQFPEAKFVKSQVQDKEGQLKKEYKVVKSIVNRSGISWNSTSCMINTTPEKWEEIVEEDPKFRRLQGKEFPLFDALDLLYEGNISQGKHCVTSSQPPHITSRKRQSDERQSTRNVALKISAMTSQRFSEDEGQNRFSEVERTSASGRSLSYQSQNDDELNPLGGEEDEDVQRSFDQENSRSGNGGAQSARARKHRSHTSVPIPRIEETMSEFVKLKREQAGIKEQASGKQYSIPKCLEVLNVMVDVSDEIKILASDVFKDASNRELFLSYDPRLRGLWLKKEVGKAGNSVTSMLRLILLLCRMSIEANGVPQYVDVWLVYGNKDNKLIHLDRGAKCTQRYSNPSFRKECPYSGFLCEIRKEHV